MCSKDSATGQHNCYLLLLVIAVATPNQGFNNALSFPESTAARETANHRWMKYGNVMKYIFQAAVGYDIPVLVLS